MSTSSYNGLKYSEGKLFRVNDMLVVEESLKITINNNPFTVTMRTPGSETKLVRGLLFSENVYTDRETDPEISVTCENDKGFITAVNVVVPEDKIGKGFQTTRSIISVSSCGICGKSELDEVSGNSVPLNVIEKLEPEMISNLFEQMSVAQDLFKLSGGSHAASAFTMEGKMLCIQEDIGRHNAVDKVIGDLLLEKQLFNAKYLVVSGRISYEIVNKCYAAGIPFLAAVSAPSSMAVELAEKLGITLLAFCRKDKFTAYSNVDNIVVNMRSVEQIEILK